MLQILRFKNEPMRNLKSKNNREGFTLFELLVVISIIGILMGFVTVAFSTAQKKGRDARRVDDLQMLQKALEQYYSLTGGNYPDTPGYNSGALSYSGTTLIQTFPVDPKNDDTYSYEVGTCDTTTYCYCALLENSNGNSGADCNWAGGITYYCVSSLQ